MHTQIKVSPTQTSKFFISNCAELGGFAAEISNEVIKNEPMFFNCDGEFAYEKGGPITRSFLDALPDDWKDSNVVFDSRIHMLMPGWYPAIPGWHHDDVPRPNGGQPDYDNMAYHSQHILGLVNADVCPTHFALGSCVMPEIYEGDTIYQVWNEEVQRLLDNDQLHKIVAKDRTLYYFDWETFHTGVKATGNGWRWFGRVTRNSDRVKNVTNEIRINTQVYLEFPTQGW